MRYAAFLTIAFFLLAGCGSTQQSRMGMGEPNVVAAYDEFEDMTTYRSDPAVVLNRGMLSDLVLDAHAVCPSQEECTPEQVLLRFRAFSDTGWRYLENHRLVLLSGDDRIAPETTHDGNVENGGRTNEVMTASLSLSQFQDFISQSNPRGRLGGTEFEIEEDEKEQLSMLARKFNQ